MILLPLVLGGAALVVGFFAGRALGARRGLAAGGAAAIVLACAVLYAATPEDDRQRGGAVLITLANAAAWVGGVRAGATRRAARA